MIRTYETVFHAAHYIKNHPKCGTTHGHTYSLKVYVDIEGWIDFHDVKARVDKVLEKYDHKDLGFATCEDIAENILKALRNVFPRAKWLQVELKETPEFGVIVSE